MRYFKKRISPARFEDWKAGANPDWTPSYADLRGEPKQQLHRALIEEQSHACCYCGRSIDESNSHVEHFRPQERFDTLALDYANLHASCERTPKGQRSAWHCGHAKANDFCEERAVSPLDEGCEARFLYTMRGAVLPAQRDDGPAEYMRDLLGLDREVLREWRRAELERVFDDAFVESATVDVLRTLAHESRQPDEHGRMNTFGHVIARHAEQLIARLPVDPQR